MRYSGEPVALLIAESRYLAEDAAELLNIDYEPLEVVLDPDAGTVAGRLVVERPRPTVDVVHILTPASGFSYPSGHAVFFTWLSFMLAVSLAPRIKPIYRPALWVGAVIVIFDEDRENRYDYLTTWLGEHQNESDMAFYSTHPF